MSSSLPIIPEYHSTTGEERRDRRILSADNAVSGLSNAKCAHQTGVPPRGLPVEYRASMISRAAAASPGDRFPSTVPLDARPAA